MSAEDLGGGDVHTRLSGVADHLANDDAHALQIARAIAANLASEKRSFIPRGDGAAPLYDPEELLGVVSADTRIPYDVREVIARLVDGSDFDEFKARYGTTLVCSFASVYGMPVGIITNNGVLFSKQHSRARISSSFAASAIFRWCFCKISPALWSGANMRPKALPSTAPNW